MDSIAELVAELRNRDNQQAYACLKTLLERSEHSNEVYAFFDAFADLMRSEQSYQRTRGVLLMAANARWDWENKMDENIDELLKRLPEVKPIEARQYIRALGEIAAAKPELAEDITRALQNLNTFRYPGTMQSLIREDIADALKKAQNSI